MVEGYPRGCINFVSPEPFSDPAVRETIANETVNIETRELCGSTARTCLGELHYSKVFYVDEVAQCFKKVKLELTTTKMLT